jgi:hypothetical protein
MDIDLENIDLEKICTSLGFEITPYKFRGRDITNLMEISRNDKFITIVSNRYKLLPNEFAELIGEDVASRVGAKLVNRIADGNMLILTYLLDEFQINNSKAQAGFFITNSIDERMSFRIKSFLWYENEVIYLGSLVSGVIRRHTKNIDIDMDNVVSTAREAVTTAEKFAKQIPDWSQISVVSGKGIGLMEKIRVSLIPGVYRPAYLLKPTKRVKENEIPPPPANLSLFRMYMDIIHTLNNPPTGRLSENTKINYFNMLHKAISEVINK